MYLNELVIELNLDWVTGRNSLQKPHQLFWSVINGCAVYHFPLKQHIIPISQILHWSNFNSDIGLILTALDLLFFIKR